MRCVTLVSYVVLVNGQPTKRFIPHKALCQGDPISPHLFLLCADGLSSLILDLVTKNSLHGIRICRNDPSISHLFFVDDSLLFTRVNQNEAGEVLKILALYG